jgi:hypothetical protein
VVSEPIEQCRCHFGIAEGAGLDGEGADQATICLP